MTTQAQKPPTTQSAPVRLTLQWHLTDACNYRCTHCYQTSYGANGVSMDHFRHYLHRAHEWAETYRQAGQTARLHINFTGGEPFVHPQFIDFLEYYRAQVPGSFGVLSNGLLLSEAQMQRFARLRPSFVQISLEGRRATNNAIRGPRSYDDVRRALRQYARLGIRTLVSFTANAQNYREFPYVVRLARRYGVQKVWTDRYLPIRPGDNLMLSTEQFRQFVQLVAREQRRQRWFWWSKTQVATDRALQFLEAGGAPYRCSAGKTLMALLPNGDVLPCRRLPIVLGNARNESFAQLQQHPVPRALHNPQQIDATCQQCHYAASCFGGLKCLSYAQTGDFAQRDPNCWLQGQAYRPAVAPSANEAPSAVCNECDLR